MVLNPSVLSCVLELTRDYETERNALGASIRFFVFFSSFDGRQATGPCRQPSLTTKPFGVWERVGADHVCGGVFRLVDTPRRSTPPPALWQTEGKMDGEILHGGKPREQRGGIGLGIENLPKSFQSCPQKKRSNEDEERFRERIFIEVSFPPCYPSTFHGVHG